MSVVTCVRLAFLHLWWFCNGLKIILNLGVYSSRTEFVFTVKNDIHNSSSKETLTL